MGIVSAESERPREAAEVEQWIVEAHQGDSDALGRLLELCRNYLLLVANRELSPTLSAKIAPSDIVQDTLLNAGRDFPRFRGSSEEELLAWLRGILSNRVMNVSRHFAAEKRQVSREISLADAPFDQVPPDPGESPSRQAAAHERDEQLERAIERLPDHYRQVLELHPSEGLTFAQIAEKLGSTTEAVRKLWVRATDELAKHLDSSHESP